jgi:hypothetical protein
VREDQLEVIEDAFPSGYLIIYTQPNGNIRMAFHNPLNLKQINETAEFVKENFNERN